MKAIAIKTLVDPTRITYLSGWGNYTRVHLVDGQSVLHPYTLLEFQRKLPDFLRVHKRFLVNLQHVHRFDQKNRMIWCNGTMLVISRRKLAEVLAKIN